MLARYRQRETAELRLWKPLKQDPQQFWRLLKRIGVDRASAMQPTDERMRDIIARVEEELGFSYQRMPSSAGHDTQDLANITPTGMIFVPSVDGISHSPDEFTSAADIANGASVLLRTVLAVDGGALEKTGSE